MNEIKDNHVKSIASATMNLSAITLFDENFKQLSMNKRIKVKNSNLNQRLKKIFI